MVPRLMTIRGLVLGGLVLVLAGCTAPSAFEEDLASFRRPSPVRPRGQSPRAATGTRASYNPNAQSSAIQPTAAPAIPESPYELRACAWVNGTPIFTSELHYTALPHLYRLSQSGTADYAAERAKILKQQLKQLIETEVVYQDAYGKLKDNPTMLKRIQNYANKTYERKLAQFLAATRQNRQEFERKLQQQGSSIAAQRRKHQREVIVKEYLRSRVVTHKQDIGHQEIRDYYDTHREEFQTTDQVDWEDIFIEAGTQRNPTMSHARQFGQQLAGRLEAGEPIANLLPHDDGDAVARKGKGGGTKRGEIRPAVLEAHLFRMKPGEVRSIQISTGIHVFRLVKREEAGLRPFNKLVQDRIRTKLEGELLNREFRGIIRQLASRTVIEVDAAAVK